MNTKRFWSFTENLNAVVFRDVGRVLCVNKLRTDQLRWGQKRIAKQG